ncbi:Trans-aconitate 2-methyltransferase [Candidatus Bilamarchaeum dharawalense]|uniref:Trans-aconitate 2-methyltransferase n=1 Tax=Candidatus Bilamarchaeum dharawalense TaxID=2885759 RepID=A0A5E4LND5_9ARCH|nr:Trans-aconitate 2-methyltransferase [Candidatus Bilamarchaeum dharawalense]
MRQGKFCFPLSHVLFYQKRTKKVVVMDNKDKWNILAKKFDTYSGQIDPSAADQMIIAWPIILNEITIHRRNNNTQKILDYGCGAGGFCNLLHSEGFQVTGIDLSDRMIEIARKNSPDAITYFSGDLTTLKLEGKFGAISSSMVFQFLKNIESYLQIFHSLLEKQGLIVFAVVSPDFVRRCARDNIRYFDLDPPEDPKAATIRINSDLAIPVYPRSEEEYKKLFAKFGFDFVSSHHPNFTKEFVEKYKWPLPWDTPEYLIITFRKI